jgi:[lysine-biosynthesis-protein LysW]--L-2-aminoadipate ligase
VTSSSQTRRVALVHDRVRPEEKLLMEALRNTGASVSTWYAPDLLWSTGDALADADVVLLRTLSHARTLTLARLLEADGHTVVNSAYTIDTAGDKAATSAVLKATGVEQPKSYVAFSEAQVQAACEQLGYPVVLKPTVGSWGRMVSRLSDWDSVQAVLEHKSVLGGPQHQVFYLQEHVNKPGRDLRAFVVGDDVVAAIAREGEDWRTNTARGATAYGVEVTDAMRTVALRAAEAVGGGILAVDLLESERGLLVGEINHGMEFRNSIDTTGVDIPARMADWLIHPRP